MIPQFVNISSENLNTEHLGCIIRSKPHAGIDAKRQWLASQLEQGHVFRKLNVKAPVFIEYAPLDKAFVPILGDNFFYIYCLWIDGKEFRGKGYGKQLLEDCIKDAKAKGMKGLCLLGSKKQKHWLTSQDFAKKHGFKVVDTTESGYELLALVFNEIGDGDQFTSKESAAGKFCGEKLACSCTKDDSSLVTFPRFTRKAKEGKIDSKELTIYYDNQCPYMVQNLETIKSYCLQNNVPVSFIQVTTLEQAKNLPCVFNNFAVFYKGEFQTVNLLLDVTSLKKILAN